MGHAITFHVICVLCSLCVPSILHASSIPLDSFLIDCGGNTTSRLDDGRFFEPDIGNSNVDLSPSSHIVVFDTQMSIAGYPTPYNSARIFRETSKYTIRTKQSGRYFLRLHFCPIENPQYNAETAVFSVVACGITLLHGFSFRQLGKISTPLIKEYALQVDETGSQQHLVLTLSPCKGSIAFISAVEVVFMPKGLFPSIAGSVPPGPEVEIPGNAAIETAYRINMGGPLITAKNDSLWRTWEPDQPYLVNAASAKKVWSNPSSVKYPDRVSVEIAPNWVYATAQEMADANVSDQRFNISWAFEIVHGFTYLVRMHFCDIVSEALNSLVFSVYINNQSALDSFDISSKTLELSAAYYVDFFVVNAKMDSNQILVQVGPTNLGNFPTNAILNGLEIMKIRNFIDSLDGNLQPGYINSKTLKRNNWRVLAISSCSAVFAVLVLISAAFFMYLRRPKKLKPSPVTWFPIPTQGGNSDCRLSIGSLASASQSNLGRILAFSKIREATKNFSENLVVGVGGFGKVYRGVLDNRVAVAVKRGNPESQQGLSEFRTEIAMLSKLKHRHLVSFIGYCEELNEMILVYEFMPGGPLRKHLYGSDLPPLSWKQRLEICIGAAKGLHYLHTGSAETIIHRDVKTTNILLDETLTAKVADFGLSKLGPTLDQTHVSTAVKGSFGYLDPEYYRRQQLTEKSDVYSFGVVLMEVLCARAAINPALPREQVNIAEWGMIWQRKGHLEKIIDPHLVGSINIDSLRIFGETAEKCLAEYGTDRPTMGDVLWNLEHALQLQEASIQNASVDNSANYIPGITEWIPNIESVDGVDSISARASDTATSSGVFSQLMDPKGR